MNFIFENFDHYAKLKLDPNFYVKNVCIIYFRYLDAF